MAQLLVRNVPDHIAAALEKRAAEHGRSAEAEHRAILETALKHRSEDFWDAARKLREELKGRTFTPSEDLIREDRDTR
ncbi:MAG: hypothetical protein JOZ72_11505 [Alphaproteobacteria bacterium]|nr:hypothetical protein [Alphaproteobacteria bacterium]